MFVVSLALAAVLIARGGGNDTAPSQAAGPNATPAFAVATATNTPEPPPVPDAGGVIVPPVSPELQSRLDLLPEKLRNETLAAYATGTLGVEQLEQIVTDFENRSTNVRVGSVAGVTDNLLRIEIYTTGEQVEVATGPETLIRRGANDIALGELQAEELVMVVSAPETGTAVTIDAFGVAAP